MTTNAQLAVVSAIKTAATDAALRAHSEILASASQTVANITTATGEAGLVSIQQVSSAIPPSTTVQPGPINRFLAFVLKFLKSL